MQFLPELLQRFLSDLHPPDIMQSSNTVRDYYCRSGFYSLISTVVSLCSQLCRSCWKLTADALLNISYSMGCRLLYNWQVIIDIRP